MLMLVLVSVSGQLQLLHGDELDGWQQSGRLADQEGQLQPQLVFGILSPTFLLNYLCCYTYLQVSSTTGPKGTKLSNAARVARSVKGQTELLWSGHKPGRWGQGQGSNRHYFLYKCFY